MNYLHRHSEFEDLLKVLADEKKIQKEIIEKDYWVMHSLWGLQKLDLKFDLKGGTSLAKAFKVIDRFSEDIDIKIQPPLGMDVKTGKNQDKKSAHIKSRDNFFNWLVETIQIGDIVSVSRDSEFDDPKLRNAGIVLSYNTTFDSFDSTEIKDGVLLEVGFDVTIPNEKKTLSSWAYDRAVESGLEIMDNRAIDVPCYLPTYTFVEKLQAISRKYRVFKETGKLQRNFLRHYYDVYRLLELEDVQSFIKTAEYRNWKEEKFQARDNKNLAENEAFTMTDSSTRKHFEEQYIEKRQLYFGEQVPFDIILERIQSYLPNL